MDIRAVIFDVDGVLIDSFDANLNFFQDLMLKAGHKAPTRKSYAKIFHLTMLNAIKALTKSTSEIEINKIWDMGKNRIVKYDYKLLSSPLNLEKTLRVLNENYLLGIATSRIKESVYESPQLKSVRKYFKTTVCYQDTVNHKPDPEPLLLAAKKLKVEPNECVYVGDVESDIKAAKAAKMKVIIYSKNKFSEADICISDFEKIPSAVNMLKV